MTGIEIQLLIVNLMVAVGVMGAVLLAEGARREVARLRKILDRDTQRAEVLDTAQTPDTLTLSIRIAGGVVERPECGDRE